MSDMKNLKEETLDCLSAVGKTPADIRWIGSMSEEIPIDKFWEAADREYDCGYGLPEVNNIYVVGDGWWLERQEYDGSEWWSYKTLLKKPDQISSDPVHLIFDGWRYA